MYVLNWNTNVVRFKILLLSLLFIGCEDFVEVDSPTGQIFSADVFENEATAEAAVTSLYGILRDDVLLTGTQYGVSVLMGLYADELDYYGAPGQPIDWFYQHQIIASNAVVKNIWDSSYNLIYMCNSAIDGIANSQTLEQEVKDQLIGEALFVRALVHFYLVNLYGDIPYITTTDYTVNQDVSRLSTALVYSEILSDLIIAKSQISETYVSGERIRANRYVVSALLARVYVYLEDWEAAETESSIVINANSIYNFDGNITDEFLKSSPSTILQLQSKNEGDNTIEAGTFIFTEGPPVLLALNPDFVASFEANDLRLEHWILNVSGDTENWYAPYKYKLRDFTGSSMEYSIVFRIAEQYLLRAEARAHLSHISGAIDDLNSVRTRAGLLGTSATTAPEILESILEERKFEFFTEHGHRWFDLKRTQRSESVLSPIKPNWNISDLILPVPEIELLMNPNLSPQNPGY